MSISPQTCHWALALAFLLRAAFQAILIPGAVPRGPLYSRPKLDSTCVIVCFDTLAFNLFLDIVICHSASSLASDPTSVTVPVTVGRRVRVEAFRPYDSLTSDTISNKSHNTITSNFLDGKPLKPSTLARMRKRRKPLATYMGNRYFTAHSMLDQ